MVILDMDRVFSIILNRNYNYYEQLCNKLCDEAAILNSRDWEIAKEATEKLLDYLDKCIWDIKYGDFMTCMSYKLAILDRAEESLKWAIKAAKNKKLYVYHRYNTYYFFSKQSACFIMHQLVAKLYNENNLIDIWKIASLSCDEMISFIMKTSQYCSTRKNDQELLYNNIKKYYKYNKTVKKYDYVLEILKSLLGFYNLIGIPVQDSSVINSLKYWIDKLNILEIINKQTHKINEFMKLLEETRHENIKKIVNKAIEYMYHSIDVTKEYLNNKNATYEASIYTKYAESLVSMVCILSPMIRTVTALQLQLQGTSCIIATTDTKTTTSVSNNISCTSISTSSMSNHNTISLQGRVDAAIAMVLNSALFNTTTSTDLCSTSHIVSTANIDTLCSSLHTERKFVNLACTSVYYAYRSRCLDKSLSPAHARMQQLWAQAAALIERAIAETQVERSGEGTDESRDTTRAELYVQLAEGLCEEAAECFLQADRLDNRLDMNEVHTVNNNATESTDTDLSSAPTLPVLPPCQQQPIVGPPSQQQPSASMLSSLLWRRAGEVLLAYCDITTKNEGARMHICAFEVLALTLTNLAKQVLAQNDLICVDTYLRLIDTGLALGQQAVRLGEKYNGNNRIQLPIDVFGIAVERLEQYTTTVCDDSNLQEDNVLYLYLQQMEAGFNDTTDSLRYKILDNINRDVLRVYKVNNKSYKLNKHVPQLLSLFVYTLHQQQHSDGIDIIGPSPSASIISTKEYTILLPVVQEIIEMYVKKANYLSNNSYDKTVIQLENSIANIWKMGIVACSMIA